MPVDYSLRTKRNEFRARGIFYTPPELGNYMKSFLPPDLTEIYDPTCGHGALLELFPPEVRKYGQEINPEAIPTAQSLPNSVIVHGDTLTNPAFLDRRFAAIIANPPFSMRWTPAANDPRFWVAPALPPKGNADFAFLLHILYLLAPNGIAVTIVPGGALYRGHAEGKIRQWLIEQNYVDAIISIPPDTFQDTAVAVVVMVLKKDRTQEDAIVDSVTFSDKASGVTVEISRKEIKKNDFILSPATYLPAPEKEDPLISLAEVQQASRQRTLEHLKRVIEIERITLDIDPTMPPLEGFLDELQAIIDAARKPRRIRLKSYSRAELGNLYQSLQLPLV